jgi:hypothetical protein
VLQPAYSRHRHAALSIEGFDDFVTSIVAPIATGWSESCRVGISPTEDRHLGTAHKDSRPLFRPQVPPREHAAEARPLQEELQKIQDGRRRGPQLLGDILPIVLARLGVGVVQSEESGE